MNIEQIRITRNGRPDYALIVKYKLENEAKKIGDKFISEIMPKVDEFFETRGGLG